MRFSCNVFSHVPGEVGKVSRMLGDLTARAKVQVVELKPFVK